MKLTPNLKLAHEAAGVLAGFSGASPAGSSAPYLANRVTSRSKIRSSEKWISAACSYLYDGNVAVSKIKLRKNMLDTTNTT